MGLINPKPRFGYDPVTGMIYDYVAQKDVPVTATPYSASDGTWDLQKVKNAILFGGTLEVGHVTLVTPKTPGLSADAQPAPKVAAPSPITHGASAIKPPQAAGFGAITRTAPLSPTLAAAAPIGSADALSPAQLATLSLSPLQGAALGLTAAQMKSGLTGAEIEAIGMTAARADALQLTPAQRAAFLP